MKPLPKSYKDRLFAELTAKPPIGAFSLEDLFGQKPTEKDRCVAYRKLERDVRAGLLETAIFRNVRYWWEKGTGHKA